MKKILLLSICIMLTLATSLKVQSQVLSPIQFNDRLTAITDTIFQMGQQWGLQFNKAFKTKDFISLKPIREKLNVYLADNIRFVTNMPNVKNSQPLKDAMISFLKVEQVLMKEIFSKIELLNASSGDEKIKSTFELLSKDTREAAELKKVQVAQKVYASQNGFTIESNDEPIDEDF